MTNNQKTFVEKFQQLAARLNDSVGYPEKLPAARLAWEELMQEVQKNQWDDKNTPPITQEMFQAATSNLSDADCSLMILQYTKTAGDFLSQFQNE